MAQIRYDLKRIFLDEAYLVTFKIFGLERGSGLWRRDVRLRMIVYRENHDPFQFLFENRVPRGSPSNSCEKFRAKWSNLCFLLLFSRFWPFSVLFLGKKNPVNCKQGPRTSEKMTQNGFITLFFPGKTCPCESHQRVSTPKYQTWARERPPKNCSEFIPTRFFAAHSLIKNSTFRVFPVLSDRACKHQIRS